MGQFTSAMSLSKDGQAAAEEVAAKLAGSDPGLVVFFVSTNVDFNTAARTLHAKLPAGTTTVGCTTAGEISSSGFSHDSLVAMSIPKDALGPIAGGVVADIVRHPEGTKGVVEKMGKQLGVDFKKDDCSNVLGLVFFDGMSGAEEKVMNYLGEAAFNQVFVGGSAGDDLKFKSTAVFLNGEGVSNAAVLVAAKATRPFLIMKTQSFKTRGVQLTVTRASEGDRIVHEFDGVPAAQAYSKATGVPVEKLAEVAFIRHPVGVMVDGEPYVRSPQQVLPDGSIKFYCNIKEGGTVSVLEVGDTPNDTALAFDKAKEQLGGVSGMIIFSCILRYLELKSRGSEAQVGKIYAQAPSVGFNTYGEAYLSHINQTCTAVFFK